MSWNKILDGRGFIKWAPRLQRTSDTFYSNLTNKLKEKKIDLMLKNQRSLVNVDTKRMLNILTQKLALTFGKFITKVENYHILRGTLELVETNISHPDFGNNLDLFTISNPFSQEKPIFLYFNKSQIKRAGLFGEVKVKNFKLNQQNQLESMGEFFFKENIEFKIPLTIQDITDFDEVFKKKFYLNSNLTGISLGGSNRITSLQKLWIPLVSGTSIKKEVEGINAYSLVNFQDHGSMLKECMDYLVNYFQPFLNKGTYRFNQVDFNIRKKDQVYNLTDETHRKIFQSDYLKGYRANIGTVISGRNRKETEFCIKAIKDSSNTDYTNILDGLTFPRNLKTLMNREKLLTGNLRYYLLLLKVLPVSYNILDIKNYSAKEMRLSNAFAKTTPYVLDPEGDEVIVPKSIKESHLSGVKKFNKENLEEVNNYIEDNHLLK